MNEEPKAGGPATTGPVLVPLVDLREGERIYAPLITRLAAAGGAAGALLFGVGGYALAVGWVPVPHLGQFAAAGTAPAVFTAAGLGLALGALGGALAGVTRLPRRPMQH